MPFRFRLKNLLRHREFKLREAQAALGAAVSDQNANSRRDPAAAETIRRQSDDSNKSRKNGIEPSRYLYFKDHLSSLERELLVLFKRLERAWKEVKIAGML